MKVLPGRTTVTACERCPVRTCNSCFVAARLLSQRVMRPLSQISLGVGNLSFMWVESTSMPKKGDAGCWSVYLLRSYREPQVFADSGSFFDMGATCFRHRRPHEVEVV